MWLLSIIKYRCPCAHPVLQYNLFLAGSATYIHPKWAVSEIGAWPGHLARTPAQLRNQAPG